MRNYLWTLADNVVTGVPSRRRGKETDRHADDRRRYYIGDSQPLDLSGHLRDLEEAFTSFRASLRTVARPAGLRTGGGLGGSAQDSGRFYGSFAGWDRHRR